MWVNKQLMRVYISVFSWCTWIPMSFSALKFFRGDISCTSGHRGPAPPPRHLTLFLCLFILPALSPAGLPATEGAQHIFRYNSTMHRWQRLLFKHAGNTNSCSGGDGKQKHWMQPDVSLSLSCFFCFFLNLLHIFSYGSAGEIHLFWSLMKCAVWVCGRMHICMCAVCQSVKMWTLPVVWLLFLLF